MNTILIIDDEPGIRMLLGRILELEGYEVLKARDRAAGLDAMKAHDVQVILCDVFLPDGNGVDMVPELCRLAPDAKVVLLTAHGNIPDGVRAIKNGAFDYIVKGDDNRKIIPIVSRAMDAVAAERKRSRMMSRSALLQDGRHVVTFDAVIGSSQPMLAAVRLARKVAVTDVPVLLTGETGTGKEVFAQAIHNASGRSAGPIVAINCSAFSRDLLESEIFGHKAGSFTGATKDKKGLFEEADHGTIFLDEVGEMAPELQAKLLRVLEMGEFLKIGDTKPTKVDVRVLSATNRNLKEEISHGRFREDLFFRLSVFNIGLPSLRERREDIPILVDSFVKRLSAQLGRECPAVSGECMDAMKRYFWPGNVRELQNVIERALIVCDGEITCNDLPLDMLSESAAADFALDMPTVERNHIIKVLKFTGGNKTEAARLLKIGLTTLYRKIEEYGIKSD